LGETRARAAVQDEKAVLHDKLSSLPNVPFHEVPDGESEDDNVELSKWGEPRKFDFDPKDHSDLGEALGMMDFETAAKMSGSRFVVLRGALSRMDRAGWFRRARYNGDDPPASI